MHSINYKQLRSDAAASVQSFGRLATKLILIYAGVSAGLSLLLSVLNYGMDQILAGTSGLSDIGTITLIETIQTFLTYVQSIATPFWQMGYLFAVMQLNVLQQRFQTSHIAALETGFFHLEGLGEMFDQNVGQGLQIG